MTGITSCYVKSRLISRVPTSGGGGTNIGLGLLECRRILRSYAKDQIDRTRIVLLSDGDGSIGNAIDDIIADGITLDTILYEQGGYLADKAKETGGKEFLASDEYEELELTGFLAESASRGCEAKYSSAVLNNNQIRIPAGEKYYTDRIGFDVTTGKDTKIVFKCSSDVDVSISGEQNLTALGIQVVTIKEDVEEYVEYTITNQGDVGRDVTVLVAVTSSPIPGVEPIVISHRLNDYDIQFTADSKLTTYLGVFQGVTPIQKLQTKIIVEQPNGVLVEVPCYDDGTGNDSVPNDDIYTGSIPPHKIDGSGGGTYFGLKLDISGEGVIPGEKENGGRGRRNVNFTSLGNITRSATDGDVYTQTLEEI